MSSDRERRAVDAALVPIVAALRPWGVEDGHWLPDRSGTPVVWLRTHTEIERVALQSQAWVIAQVQSSLTRLDVSYEVVRSLRLEITSTEGEAVLFEE